MYVSLINRIFNWAINWKLIMLALKTDLVLALVWNSVWKIATTFSIFSGFARLEKKAFWMFLFCFVCFAFVFCFFFNENKMFDQTKRKEMENKQISWEKAKNDQKKKKNRERESGLTRQSYLITNGFLGGDSYKASVRLTKYWILKFFVKQVNPNCR